MRQKDKQAPQNAEMTVRHTSANGITFRHAPQASSATKSANGGRSKIGPPVREGTANYALRTLVRNSRTCPCRLLL